ncbi:MAG: AAA family ATPase, partial [Ruminococcus sp.]
KKKQPQFSTYVRIGEQLDSMAATVAKYKKRACYSAIYDYVFGEQQDKVFILYGLRRTGKTTLIRQIILNMKPEERQKTAFIQIKSSDTLSDVNADLRTLEEQGYKYIFVDEVTLMEDFIEGAALFSDIYASSGMKLVLSGTDSLGFIFTKHEQLYDRCIMLHTTFISYREFEQVLGIQGIDNYIRYGGTMSISGVNYNDSTFTTKQSTDEYIDSAIARNIQHSLKYYQDGGHFRNLYDLYEKGELTSAINRVVEDINHRFTKEVLTRTFSSHDLSLSARNLLHDRENAVDLYQTIDKEAVTATLKSMLDILDKEEQKVEIDETHAAQIKEYLAMLDLLMEVDLQYLPHVNRHGSITVITQPGMRYAQATALVNSMMLDEKFSTLSAVERKRILERILSEIKGRMMEDIVLLETKLANPDKEVFQLQFAVGEFDMVVVDSNALTCEIFEIKYSKEVVPAQYRHLIDEEKCAQTEHRFGTITARTVIYRGETTESDNVKYINVEEYLKLLWQKK